MVLFGKRKRKTPRRLVIFLILGLFSFTSLFSQDAVSRKDDPRITVEISPDRIIVGQRFDLTIFGDFPSYRSVHIKAPVLPDGISLAGGPYKSAQTIRVGDISEPKYIKKTRVYYKFKVNRPGIFVLNSFVLSDGKTTLETEPITFPAVSYDERDFKYPVFASWKALPEEVMVGETFPLILEMENLETLTFPDNVKMTPPSGGMFERVNSLGEITVKEIGEDEVYVAPIDSWLYTPTSPGRLAIPVATVEMGNIKRQTSHKTLTVVETPPEISKTGAIGSFKLTTQWENGPVTRGKVSLLRIRVEGEGNLNYLIMPEPVFSGLTIIDKEEKSDFSPGLRGYSGYREDVYKISAGEETEVSVQFPVWSWFDPSSGTINQDQPEPENFTMEKPTEETPSLSFREEFTLLSIQEIVKERRSFYNIPFYYLLILPGLFSIVVALVRNHYDSRLSVISVVLLFFLSSATVVPDPLPGKLEKAEELLSTGKKEEARQVYAGLTVEYRHNSALFYNLALLEYDLSNKGESIYNLRKALTLKPGKSLYLSALSSLENAMGLERQVRASTGLSPDLFFLIFLILFNSGAFVISLNIRKRKMELTILIIMIFFLSVLSLSIVLYSDWISRSPMAVVSTEERELKKVPGELGGSWLTLQEGTAVSLLSRSGNSWLIRTGYGLEGWLDDRSLLFLKEP